MQRKANTTNCSPFVRLGLAVCGLLLCLAVRPANAASPASIVGGDITVDTTWTLAGSPYQVDSDLFVLAGVTLTIDPGVVVQNYPGGFENYGFYVQGTLLANGTADNPIHFLPGLNGWSGIVITGEPGNINTGSSLTYVIAEGGGYGGPGVGANLILNYALVDVFNCQFNDSPGDGILGDNASAQGVVNIYDTSFTGNAGYAVDFEDGSVNPILRNLSASGNGGSLSYGEGNAVYINDATLHGLHTWENMGLPYLIVQTVVDTDSNLIIEPGVQVLAYPGNDALDVYGLLIAEATAGQEIRFDPLDPSLGWAGISILGTEALPGAGGVFDHVIITKGGYTGGSCDLYIEYGNATVRNSQLDSSGGSGLCLDYGSTLVVTDTLFTNNQVYPIHLLDVGSLFTLDNLTASGNTHNAVGMKNGILYGPHLLPKSGINTYDLYGNLTVAPTGTLTIDRGVTVLFGASRDITVFGIFNAIGTLEEPILFSADVPTPGQWAGVNFYGTAEQPAVGRFAYATLEYGGYGGAAMVSIQNANVTFSHCLLRYCSANAIEIFPGKAVTADTAILDWSRLHNIGGYAIQNALAQPVQAHYTWWGDASGPAADDNPGGTGSALLGPVNYWPYLTGLEPRFVFLPIARK